MTMQSAFSNVTKDYLSRFYQILDQMIQGMTGAKRTDSISHNFILQMIPHHRAAIEIAQNILQYTTCLPLQHLAANIITEQTQSIENMQSVLERCALLSNSAQELCLYQRRFDQIARTMFSAMENACSANDINANFMREMIPHHEGAVKMSENALRYPICPELVPILQAIIASQRAQVREMTRWLRCM